MFIILFVPSWRKLVVYQKIKQFYANMKQNMILQKMYTYAAIEQKKRNMEYLTCILIRYCITFVIFGSLANKT